MNKSFLFQIPKKKISHCRTKLFKCNQYYFYKVNNFIIFTNNSVIIFIKFEIKVF